jgi:DNA-binding CsgD family transcriptional regulator
MATVTNERQIPTSGTRVELTPRERDVLRWVAEGKTSWEIARILGLSPKTVDHYRSKLHHKLDVHKDVQLVRAAMDLGLVPDRVPLSNIDRLIDRIAEVIFEQLGYEVVR